MKFISIIFFILTFSFFPQVSRAGILDCFEEGRNCFRAMGRSIYSGVVECWKPRAPDVATVDVRAQLLEHDVEWVLDTFREAEGLDEIDREEFWKAYVEKWVPERHRFNGEPVQVALSYDHYRQGNTRFAAKLGNLHATEQLNKIRRSPVSSSLLSVSSPSASTYSVSPLSLNSATASPYSVSSLAAASHSVSSPTASPHSEDSMYASSFQGSTAKFLRNH